MSILENMFKLKKIDEEKEKAERMNLLMQVTNNKMTLKEVERVYKALDSEVMKKVPKNMQIIESMELIEEMKGDWLTKEEKESFVTGVWMFNSIDSEENTSSKKYMNPEQLKYVRQAVLGMEFKVAKDGKYYAEYNEYKHKY